MARRKRPNPLLLIARTYLNAHQPELKDAPLRLRTLDGPPGSPRYSVTAEVCPAGACPFGIAPDAARSGTCAVYTCPLRHSVRLLLDRRGEVLQETNSGVHWG